MKLLSGRFIFGTLDWNFTQMPKAIYLPPLLAFLAGSVDLSRPTAELWKMHLI